MRIQILSDLHLEFDRDGQLFQPEKTDADVLVLGGDIQVGLEQIQWFADRLKDYPLVIYILASQGSLFS